MEKNCPLCGSKNWNYDIHIYGLNTSFCGDCWHDIKAEAYKLGWFSNGKAMPKGIYNKVLRLASAKLARVLSGIHYKITI